MVSHWIGVSLGKPSEFTGLAVLEAPARGTLEQGEKAIYALRHLRRWSPGTGYPEIAADVRDLAGGWPFEGSATLLIDQTGVGRAIVDLFRPAPARRVPVEVTGGIGVPSNHFGVTSVPKLELIGAVQVLLQTRRLKIASGMREAAILVRELDRYREKMAASDEMEAWRDGDLDDLVLSTALVCWHADRQPAFRPPEPFGPPRSRQSLQQKIFSLAQSRSGPGLFGQNCSGPPGLPLPPPEGWSHE
jgi:hypothetical protein